jgi:hypothetical protein
MAIPFYYNPATNELELTADPSPLRDSLGTRFGLNEISIARNTLSPTKSHTAGLSESFPGTFTSYNDAVSDGFQGTREEWLQQQSIPITERPLTGAAGGRVDMKPGGIVEPGVEYYAILTEAEKRANVKTWEKNTGLNFEDVENKKKSYNIRSGSMTGTGPGKKIKWTPEKIANYKKWIKLYSLEEYNKLHPDSQHHIREGLPVKAVETRGKNLNKFFTQEIAKANAGEKFVSQKEILQKAYKKFNLKKITSQTYPVLTTLETRADKIDKVLKNMLMETKPLKNLWQDAILTRTGLNNIILQRTLDSGNVKTYNVLADQGAAFIRQNIPRANWQKGSYDFIKNLSFSDQLSKALEIIEGRPILTGIQTVGGRASAPKFKVMQFAFRSWNQNQGKGPIQFFDKNGKLITWEFGGKKLPVGEITFEYKGKKYNTKNLSDPSLVKKDFPEVYKTQTNIDRFANKEIDNPFKPGEKISVRKLIKQIQVDGYKWSPKTGSLAILHGSEGVKNKPFTDLVFNTTDINQLEQGLERKLTSKKITKSQYNNTLKDLRGLFKGTTGLDYEQSIIDRLKTQVKEIQKYKGEGKPLEIGKLLQQVQKIPKGPGRLGIIKSLLSLGVGLHFLNKYGISSAEAAEAKTLEPGDKKQEASVSGDVAKGAGAIALGTAVTHPKQAWELAKKTVLKPLDKIIAPFLTPAISIAAHGKPDVTSGLEWITPAFWNAMAKRFGLEGTIQAFKNAPDAASKSRLAINMLLRAGIPMKALPIISGAAATVSGPLLVSDAAKALQKRIDKQGLTGIIEEQSGIIGDEAGASLLMEDVIKEKKRRDAEGMDYAQGGIASLMK